MSEVPPPDFTIQPGSIPLFGDDGMNIGYDPASYSNKPASILNNPWLIAVGAGLAVAVLLAVAGD